MTDAVVAFSTVARMEDAEHIARTLVQRRLAACVNIVPGLTSVYAWKGEVESDQELLLVIKTRRERLDALRQALLKIHPYEVPELIALPVEGGSEAYLKWIGDSVD